jgi:hypothetical protein
MVKASFAVQIGGAKLGAELLNFRIAAIEWRLAIDALVLERAFQLWPQLGQKAGDFVERRPALLAHAFRLLIKAAQLMQQILSLWTYEFN